MKIVVDILMFILMLLEFSRGYIKPIYHEIFGILLFILVIIHLVLNRNYIKNILKGKYNYSRYVMLIINLGFFLTFFLSIVFGMLSSQDLLKFMNIHSVSIVNLHKIFGYISLIFMGLHLGITFDAMFGKIKLNKTLVYVIDLILLIYGVYSFIKLDIIKHVTGTYGFSITDGNIAINILRYLSIVMMLGIVVKNIDKFVKSRRKNK